MNLNLCASSETRNLDGHQERNDCHWRTHNPMMQKWKCLHNLTDTIVKNLLMWDIISFETSSSIKYQDMRDQSKALRRHWLHPDPAPILEWRWQKITFSLHLQKGTLIKVGPRGLDILVNYKWMIWRVDCARLLLFYLSNVSVSLGIPLYCSYFMSERHSFFSLFHIYASFSCCCLPAF